MAGGFAAERPAAEAGEIDRLLPALRTGC